MIAPVYSADNDRYKNGMKYRRCGKSGIMLPEISLGLWHNFGDVDTFSNSQRMAHYAFDKGITHFDLANNYRRNLRRNYEKVIHALPRRTIYLHQSRT